MRQILSQKKQFFQLFCTVFLLSFYPVILIASQNSEIVLMKSIILPSLLILVIYLIITIFFIKGAEFSINNSIIGLFVFSLGFWNYGIIYDLFRYLDLFPVFTPMFLVIYSLLCFYLIFIIENLCKKYSETISHALVFVIAGLVIINFSRYVIPKITKLIQQESIRISDTESTFQSANGLADYPDIYYFILDEAIGFKQGREFFDDPSFMEYGRQLESIGFFVAYESKSRTIHTPNEVASRLNGHLYPEDTENIILFEAIASNNLFSILKKYGYTTIVFDQVSTPLFYEAKSPINADVNLMPVKKTNFGYGIYFDSFSQLVFSNTMLRPLVNKMIMSDPELGRLRESSIYLFKRVRNLSDIPSPKVVYIHLMTSHYPFIFEANGEPVNPSDIYNWNKYPGSYHYLMNEIISIVDDLLNNESDRIKPVIIIQSDHGARNWKRDYEGLPSPTLVDYPVEYQRAIINAVFLSDSDYSSMSNDEDPMDIFPLILNKYFSESFIN